MRSLGLYLRYEEHQYQYLLILLKVSDAEEKKDKISFYNRAQSSLDEVEYQLLLAHNLGYCESNNEINKEIQEISAMLNGLIKSVEESSV